MAGEQATLLQLACAHQRSGVPALVPIGIRTLCVLPVRGALSRVCARAVPIHLVRPDGIHPIRLPLPPLPLLLFLSPFRVRGSRYRSLYRRGVHPKRRVWVEVQHRRRALLRAWRRRPEEEAHGPVERVRVAQAGRRMAAGPQQKQAARVAPVQKVRRQQAQAAVHAR